MANNRASADQLRTKLKRLRLADKPNEWSDFGCRKSGLPSFMHPFSFRPQWGANYTDTGLFSIYADGVRDEILIEKDVAGEFTAFRLMVDMLEIWNEIRPVERVYFIGTELRPGALVKIGYSRDVDARLSNLQTAHAERLRIFATVEGGKGLEEKYHSRWRLRRRKGEWFTLGDCIINEINRLNSTPPTGGARG